MIVCLQLSEKLVHLRLCSPIHVGFVVNIVPNNSILNTRCDRGPHSEDQTSIKCFLQELYGKVYRIGSDNFINDIIHAQHHIYLQNFPSLKVVREVSSSGSTRESLARIRVLLTLYSTWNAVVNLYGIVPHITR